MLKLQIQEGFMFHIIFSKKEIFYYFIFIIIFTSMQNATARIPIECGVLENSYGPYDYNHPYDKKNPTKNMLNVVEKYHFNSDVKNLTGGQSASVAADLDYTLRASPNHHQALYSAVRYETGGKRIKDGKKLPKSMECYFSRATNFKPQDGIVWMLYGIYYQRKGDNNNALEKYKKALQYIPKNQELHYNMSLLYIKMENYDMALKHAKIAYKNGSQNLGLKRKLKQLDVWK